MVEVIVLITSLVNLLIAIMNMIAILINRGKKRRKKKNSKRYQR